MNCKNCGEELSDMPTAEHVCKTASVSGSPGFTGCTAKPVADFTKAEFMQACWEMYHEWQKHEGGIKLPDYENCLHYIEVNGLPD